MKLEYVFVLKNVRTHQVHAVSYDVDEGMSPVDWIKTRQWRNEYLYYDALPIKDAKRLGWTSGTQENWAIQWIEVHGYAGFEEVEPEIAKPTKPKPVICPEIWAVPIEGMDYMSAVRAMCGESRGD